MGKTKFAVLMTLVARRRASGISFEGTKVTVTP